MLTEQDVDVSPVALYSNVVRRMLHTLPGASARLQEIGELLLLAPVWSEGYRRSAPSSLGYPWTGVPPGWARDLEAGTE
ncbi:hypothetical protein [Streptomyces sp. NPDC059863]|uniref:hypothetical protein n=1 Tax=unclassified Streptomyces TaxID=2593676 RepID=UPI003651AA06